MAEKGVLVEHVPKAATPEVVVSVVKQAFANRGWTVTSSKPDSVEATIHREILSAKLRLSLVEGALRYDGEARRLEARGNPNNQVMANGVTDLPHNWMKNLKSDISLALSTIPDR